MPSPDGKDPILATLGLVAMFLSPWASRLGDLAAAPDHLSPAEALRVLFFPGA